MPVDFGIYFSSAEETLDHTLGLIHLFLAYLLKHQAKK